MSSTPPCPLLSRPAPPRPRRAALLPALAAALPFLLAACGGSSGKGGEVKNDVVLSPAHGTAITTSATQFRYFSQRFSVVSGGSSPYSFGEITNGLPAGLYLVSTLSTGQYVRESDQGDVVGFPSVSGATTLAFRVYDANQNITEQSYDLTIGSSPTALLSLSPATGSILTTGSLGGSYGPLNLTIGNGTAVYSWRTVYGGLPPGLTLLVNPTGTNSAEAQIVGTPTQVGTWIFAIEVNDSSSDVRYGGGVYQISIQ